MACDRCNYHVSFLAIFCPFNPLPAQKMKIFLKMKKTPRDIIVLHNCTKNHDHMLYTIPEIWDVTHVIFIFIFGLFFGLSFFLNKKLKIVADDKLI